MTASLAPGATVVFKSPDMNHGDVQAVLRAGHITTSTGTSSLDKNPVVLHGTVNAFTEVQGLKPTTFCLAGLAEVGMDADAMSRWFAGIHRHLDYTLDLGRDPAVWLLLGEALLPPAVAKSMLVIANDAKMTEAFVKGEPYNARFKTEVVLRYTER